MHACLEVTIASTAVAKQRRHSLAGINHMHDSGVDGPIEDRSTVTAQVYIYSTRCIVGTEKATSMHRPYACVALGMSGQRVVPGASFCDILYNMYYCHTLLDVCMISDH